MSFTSPPYFSNLIIRNYGCPKGELFPLAKKILYFFGYKIIINLDVSKFGVKSLKTEN